MIRKLAIRMNMPPNLEYLNGHFYIVKWNESRQRWDMDSAGHWRNGRKAAAYLVGGFLAELATR